MPCCTIPCTDTSRFFSRLARLYRWRFRLFGFEKTQRQLLAGVRRTDVAGKSLLEIGCGAGHLHHALLQDSASHAIGVDLSARMLAEAQKAAHDMELETRTDYRQGDFVALTGTLPGADITLMDKVVCCYPEPGRLLNAALDKTRHVVALTYPRDRWLTRLGTALMAGVLKLLGSDFRPYVHNPADIEGWITARDFTRTFSRRTLAWRTEVYRRG